MSPLRIDRFGGLGATFPGAAGGRHGTVTVDEGLRRGVDPTRRWFVTWPPMQPTRRSALLGILSTLACATACAGPAAKEDPTPVGDPPPTTIRPPEVEPVSDASLREVVSGLNAFAADLYARAAAGDGNRVIAPASVALALAMVHAGAKGPTADEIATALHQPGAGATLSEAAGALVQRWNDESNAFELAVVDRLFGDARVAFDPRYLDLMSRAFRAPLETMDFRAAPGRARERINAWVEEQTKNRIRDLVPANGITAATRLVLVNAIYFKAAWLEPFPSSLTQDGPFFAASGERTAKMMRRTAHVRMASMPDEAVSVLELPYEGGEMAMVLVLPDARDGLAAVEKRLTGARLAGWLGRLKPARVALQLPRFTIEMPAPLLLSGTLKELGIRRAFDWRQADFTGIAPTSAQLEVSEGFHKAFIAVDESGTEAAAATAISMRAGGPLSTAPPTPFVCDHPFAFAICDRKNDAILFMGRVADPTA